MRVKVRPLVAAIGALAATSCVTVKHQLTDPSVAARFNSTKSAEAFARCAAEALPEFDLEQAGNAWALTRRKDIRLVSRWDFHPFNDGSQAELRNGADDDGGVDEVRSCIGA